MYIHVPIPEGKHYERGRCPNEGHACNCIGVCRVELVRDEDCQCDGTGVVDRQPVEFISFAQKVIT